jgi:RNA polymerase sigma-70 factor (ECF subfamily)
MIQLAVPLREQSDEALFVRYASSDDQEAIRILVERYEAPVKAYLRRRIRVEAQVEDLWATTLYRMVRAKDRYDPARKFRSWVYTIAGNLLKNEYRTRSRRGEVLFTDFLRQEGARELHREFETASRVPTPDEALERGETVRRVRETLDRLPEQHRVPLTLRFLEDAPYDQIGEASGIPVGTVKSRLNRARTVFARLYAARERA